MAFTSLVMLTTVTIMSAFAVSTMNLKTGNWITYQTSVAVNDEQPRNVEKFTLKDTDLKMKTTESPGFFHISNNSKIGDLIILHDTVLSGNGKVIGISTIPVGHLKVRSFEVKTNHAYGKQNDGIIFVGTIDNFYDTKTGIMLQSYQNFTMYGVNSAWKITAINASSGMLGEDNSIVTKFQPNEIKGKFCFLFWCW